MPVARLYLLLLGFFALLLGACAHPPSLHEAKTTIPNVPGQASSTAWEHDLARFTAEDAAHAPPANPIVFVGSSSIRMWSTLAEDFPGMAVLNRGFGGSEIRDSTWYAEPFILKYQPRMVVLYAGDNDLASGRTPEQLRDDFVAFVQRLRRDQPKLPIVFISCKPSPSRANLLDAQRQANALIRREIERLPAAKYVDVFTPMLDANGKPSAELFLADRLHMNGAGYALWRAAVAPAITHDSH